MTTKPTQKIMSSIRYANGTPTAAVKLPSLPPTQKNKEKFS